jgi:hypothetical protein
MDALPKLKMDSLPVIDLRHMLSLIDDTAMLQHATWAVPDLHHGYCTDDNARALIACVMFLDLQPQVRLSHASVSEDIDEIMSAIQRCLSFLSYALDRETGRIKNFMGYDRTWLEEVGSEDSHARTLWAMGVVSHLGGPSHVQEMGADLFRRTLPAAADFESLRPLAYSLLGADAYLARYPGDHASRRTFTRAAERLFTTWENYSSDDWPWWEDSLTWGNAKLPHALLRGGARLERPEMLEAALKALKWLIEVQMNDEGKLSIIGNRGWYVRGQERAQFDQQPVETKALVQACLAAALATGEEHWIREASRCFEWFRGENDLDAQMYDEETGGCHDGLCPEGAAPNEGAESTLAYVLSVLELHHYDRIQKTSERISVIPTRVKLSE